MLGSFIRHGVTRKECEREIPFQIIAGSDTTATAIRGTLLYLTTDRVAYSMLQKEIDDFIANGKISDPITADEAKNMEYLQVSQAVHLHVLAADNGIRQSYMKGSACRSPSVACL